MGERNQQIQAILRHIERIESDLGAVRQLVTQLEENSAKIDQDLVIADAELVIHATTIQPTAVIPGGRAKAKSRSKSTNKTQNSSRRMVESTELGDMRATSSSSKRRATKVG
jgi:hypothetical protein